MEKSVYIVGVQGHPQTLGGVAKMFQDRGWKITTSLSNADLIQFTGGEDVTPAIYGAMSHRASFFNLDRDMAEMEIFYRGRMRSTPMAGICRGGQFLNVMCGGTLYQDVDNHALYGTHKATTYDGQTINVTSTHHQMMCPTDEAVVLATAEESTRREWVEPDGTYRHNTRTDGSEEDTEVVLYPDHKVLCFQPHPEYSGAPDCTRFYFESIDLLMKGER